MQEPLNKEFPAVQLSPAKATNAGHKVNFVADLRKDFINGEQLTKFFSALPDVSILQKMHRASERSPAFEERNKELLESRRLSQTFTRDLENFLFEGTKEDFKTLYQNFLAFKDFKISFVPFGGLPSFVHKGEFINFDWQRQNLDLIAMVLMAKKVDLSTLTEKAFGDLFLQVINETGTKDFLMTISPSLAKEFRIVEKEQAARALAVKCMKLEEDKRIQQASKELEIKQKEAKPRILADDDAQRIRIASTGDFMERESQRAEAEKQRHIEEEKEANWQRTLAALDTTRQERLRRSHSARSRELRRKKFLSPSLEKAQERNVLSKAYLEKVKKAEEEKAAQKLLVRKSKKTNLLVARLKDGIRKGARKLFEKRNKEKIVDNKGKLADKLAKLTPAAASLLLDQYAPDSKDFYKQFLHQVLAKLSNLDEINQERVEKTVNEVLENPEFSKLIYSFFAKDMQKTQAERSEKIFEKNFVNLVAATKGLVDSKYAEKYIKPFAKCVGKFGGYAELAKVFEWARDGGENVGAGCRRDISTAMMDFLSYICSQENFHGSQAFETKMEALVRRCLDIGRFRGSFEESIKAIKVKESKQLKILIPLSFQTLQNKINLNKDLGDALAQARMQAALMREAEDLEVYYEAKNEFAKSLGEARLLYNKGEKLNRDDLRKIHAALGIICRSIIKHAEADYTLLATCGDQAYLGKYLMDSQRALETFLTTVAYSNWDEALEINISQKFPAPDSAESNVA